MISLLVIAAGSLSAQNVGILTSNPQAPVHIASSGQVNVPGGLVVLGDTSEGHLELDIDILQTMYGDNPNILQLQPAGGSLRVGLNLMHVDGTTGFVGIGTNSPATELHVLGEMQMSTEGIGTSQKDKISIRGTLEDDGMLGLGWLKNSGGLGGLTEGNGSSNGSRSMIDIYEMYYKSEGAHRWFINQNADLLTIPKMVLNPDGWLGIGPIEPESKLQVTGGLGVSLTGDGYFQIGETSSTNLVFDTNELLARSNGNPSTLFLQYWDGDLSVCYNNAGQVAIGHSSPQAKVHITDGTDVTLASGGELILGATNTINLAMDGNEIQARSNGASSALTLQDLGGNLLVCEPSGGRLGVGTNSPSAKVHITDGTDVSLGGGGELVLGSTTGMNIAMDGNEIQARDNGTASALFLQLSGGDVLLSPNETGQVGIGVSSSANMPADDYLLAVDGKIISEEVRVELSGSWPDYVFHEGYVLTPLPELEKQIETLGHLPGIPSAENVETDGILLGDMQRSMMEKIEELTLYVIELQKEIEALKAKQ
jgi:hypothetical protein